MRKTTTITIRASAIFLIAAFVIVGFGGASIVGPLGTPSPRRLVMDTHATQTFKDLARVGLLRHTSQELIENLLAHQLRTGQPLTTILRDPKWQSKIGVSAESFKATWYAANPFDLLPIDLQVSIRKTSRPFESRSQINRWMKNMNAPDRWVKAMDMALVETTPVNLWRASRGKRPYARNGQYLQPIAVEKGKGRFELFDGHIATDPREIPTNSTVLILLSVNGEDRVLKVKAADIGEAIKGKHVDLPIMLKPSHGRNHSIRFPGEYIRNNNILILTPASPSKTNRDRKA